MNTWNERLGALVKRVGGLAKATPPVTSAVHKVEAPRERGAYVYSSRALEAYEQL
ncbi:hypothetical protein [Mesorhizobium sp. L48C026A00]|uniref:hypothetical protein n=1 Tax=Mesorhizobium sp. L48C026A00 TaxID=1287182 RepID=UPI0003CFFB02|nr:hypothetical protein [Mesorhizobium sp. L48C026A00]ESZ19947.1 hypothetical protein X737_13345 [Mesorhizobium sp. L48C026A00]